ncbi:helicase-exonuclease AddAB subunit AddB [Falsibacillus albus]|uniref:ATP-dependent helicase/deoxyribonuclease subunit B n=1 Tax=Falsibacillus albus TaxID=2478915 RepID=A0A3L7K4Q5_9BACI|nr:helicase-exonuclease AddAB subunit AddB [Falsibacillus albus]RLQ97249.1 helicase-exonuclease AddAB subunit AddB [Falsibacillus albus]
MSVRFILGRSGAGKTSYVFDEMAASLEAKPNGAPIIYLVPDQMTFLSEYRLAKSPNLNGMIRAQVFSFTRLAWRVLQETGGMGRYHLSSAGLNMLIRKIIEEQKEQLKLFGRAADKNGFVQHIESVLTEFKRYCVEPEELMIKQEELANEGYHQSLVDKLHDLELIYTKFEETLLDKYIDSEDYFRLLAESIRHSPYLQSAEIYIDGFHSFTPQEYLVIEELMKTCPNVSIALTLDKPYRFATPDDLDLFRMTGETYESLYQIASALGIPLEEKVMESSLRYEGNSLLHLERNFEHRPAIPFQGELDIELWQASNRRSEIEGIARKIRSLIQESNYRYQDIAILVRNGHDYQDVFETIFYDYDIPYFIDQKRPMLNHPLIELIRSTIEILNSNWRYEPVFRAVKTDLLFPLNSRDQGLREKMDRLENYVLANGIKGSQWTNKNRWVYRRFRGLELTDVPQTDQERSIEHEINELRLFISAPILRLSRRLKKASAGRDFGEALFLFLEELDIPSKLEKLRMDAEEKGNLVLAREHDQAWNAVIELLDQFVEMVGSERFTLKKFSTVLDSGLESMKFSIVPPAMDQVIIANLELSRLSEVKAAFVIGLNDGIMPAKISEEGVFADDDRERLFQSGIMVGPSSRRKLLDEDFIAYKAFTTPSRHLFLSYPLANEEGRALLPSPYIKRLKEMFPGIDEKMIVNDPADLFSSEQLEYISHPNVSIAYLTTQLQLKKNHYPIAGFWWDVYNFYMEHPQWHSKAKHILSSLYFQNKAKPISEAASKELYGEEILASVSRMEMFHGCPFSHFARHGLKLQDREIFRLEAPDIGEMFHGALKWIADEVTRLNLSWSSLSQEQCTMLAKEAVNVLAPKLQHQILLSSNRHHYIKKKLENVISRASIVLSQHAKASGFAPIGLELGFGPKGSLPPFTFTLKNGIKMALQGRIDRIDKSENQQGTFLRVIDYKSSAKSLDYTEVYYGLALQMLTYLDIAITHSKHLVGTEALPAGVLYFHVHNPVVKANSFMTMEEIEQEIYKSFKMKGLILDDPDIVRLMDRTLESGSSEVISAGLKKDGTLTANSQSASKEDLQYMRKYVRKIYEKTGNDITSGLVDIAPYKLKDRTPCQFCSFKPVCQFDQSMEGNQFRILPQHKQDEIMANIREEVDEDGQITDTN